LVEILRRTGAVNAERLSTVVHEGMNDEQVGAAIVRAGLLSGTELWRLQTRQSSDTLREMLRWTDCEWSFESRVRLAGSYRAQPNTPQLLIECGRNFSHEIISLRMGDEDERVAPTADITEKIEVGIQLMPNEGFVLSRLSGPMQMSEVIAVSGLPAELTRRAVYALALGGLLERTRWLRALPTELTTASRARSAAATEGAVHDTDSQQGAQPQQKPIEAREANALSVVEELFTRARGATHYEVMGVRRTASLDEIKRAYYSHAKRFHPDLFRRDADAELQQRIDAAFAKIAQAYEVLKDTSLRATYDLKLAKQKGGEQSQPIAGSGAKSEQDEARTHQSNEADEARHQSHMLADAERKFQQGMAALEHDNLGRAYAFLKEASLLVPKQARYRAYFGRVLARDKATRRQAESELLAAISLDSENASYRVMLAELYLEVGLRRKAEEELQRALALEPGNSPARRLLEDVHGTG
jgi:curved DNA-binding protein CbpA